MDSQILSLILGGAIAIVAAVITALVNYFFSKKKDNEEFIRRQKIEAYTGLINAYKDVHLFQHKKGWEPGSNEELVLLKEYGYWARRLELIAPKIIIEKNEELMNQEFYDPNRDRLDILISAMRKDLGIKD